MLQNLTFRVKILLLPGIASIAFLVLIGANLVLGQRNTERLTTIEAGYHPALEASRDFQEILTNIQRTLQDAASAADEDGLKTANNLRDAFLARLQHANANRVLKSDLEPLEEAFAAYYFTAHSTTTRLIAQETGPAVLESVQQMQQKYSSVRKIIEELTQRHRQSMAQAFASARASTDISTRLNVIIALSCLLVLLLLSFWILSSVIRALSEVARSVASASSEILVMAEKTDINSSEEASFISQTRQAMDSLLESAKEIATGAQAVLEQSERSAQASSAIAARISQLNAQALKITDVSEVIRSIADKSDLLALNASLEGSRAGEAGRPFALVGLEMRRLAETVTSAVRQIKTLASEIRELSNTAVLATEEGQRATAQTAERSRQISLITTQQRTATEQVTSSMNEIQQFAMESLTGAKEARSTAAVLVASVADLDALLGLKDVLAQPLSVPTSGSSQSH